MSQSRTVTHDVFLSLTHNDILIWAGINQFPRHWNPPHRICFLVGHISQLWGAWWGIFDYEILTIGRECFCLMKFRRGRTLDASTRALFWIDAGRIAADSTLVSSVESACIFLYCSHYSENNPITTSDWRTHSNHDFVLWHMSGNHNGGYR